MGNDAPAAAKLICLPDAFTRITNSRLVSEGGKSLSATWDDYDNDGFPDLIVANGNFDGGEY